MPKKRSVKLASNNDQKENIGMKSRKRKANSPLEVTNSKPLWDIQTNTQRTQQILKIIPGTDLLSQSSNDSCGSVSENTPAVFFSENSKSSNASSFHLPAVPGAPRILVDSQRDNVTSASDDSSENSFDRQFTPLIKPVLLLPQESLELSRNRLNKRQKIDTVAFDHFSTLSDEIILHVFGWLQKFVLAKCARVCKRWSRLVMDDSLWKRIDLSNKTLKTGVLGNVLNRGVWALRLCKTEIEGPIYSGITSPIKSARLSKVQYLDLSMAGTTPSILEQIFSICKDLRKVSLENLELNDTVCSYIGENKDLEVLNLAMCQGITANGLMPLLSNCRKLKELNIAWTHLHRHSVVYLCLCLPSSLTRLNLSGCRENISDEEVLQLCKTCPDLTELDLSDSTGLTCSSVSYIIDNLRYLEYLALSRCYNLSPSVIPELNQIPSLLAFDVYGVLREDALKVLKGGMPRIEVNQYPFSSIARPTTGIRRTSIWGIRDSLVRREELYNNTGLQETSLIGCKRMDIFDAPRVVCSVESDKIIPDNAALDQLLSLFKQFEKLPSSGKDEELVYKQRIQSMHDTSGFTVERKPSKLMNGGRGVFVTNGMVKQGCVVSLYPGVVYQPWEPVFFVSLGNPFLFRCQDGVHIDGKDTGLSKMMYKSCSKRDRELGEYTCDTSWLTEHVFNPLAVGQYVNNQNNEYPANVAYQELDIPNCFPHPFRKYIPNIEAKLDREMETYMKNKLLRTVLLVAVRDIELGEELFSTYYTIVHTGPGE